MARDTTNSRSFAKGGRKCKFERSAFESRCREEAGRYRRTSRRSRGVPCTALSQDRVLNFCGATSNRSRVLNLGVYNVENVLLYPLAIHMIACKRQHGLPSCKY